MTDETQLKSPEILVERVAAGELPESELNHAKDRLGELSESNREILERYPPEQMGAAIERRLRNDLSRSPAKKALFPWRIRLAFAVPIAAAATLLLTVLPPSSPHGDGIRVKGGHQLIVQRAVDDSGREQLKDGSIARQGDQLQLGYRLASGVEPVFGAVISIDGGGAITPHLPTRGTSQKLEANGLHALPHSYVLDDAPDFERFVLVTAEAPFALEVVLGAARELVKHRNHRVAALPLPDSLQQLSVLVLKE